MQKKSNADSKLIWIDGELVPYAEANIHILSHTLHYGTGAFEGIRAYQTTRGATAIFRAAEHFERFVDSIRVLGGETNYTISDYTAAACRTIRANDLRECYVRPLAFLDDSYRGLRLPDKPKFHTAIAVWPWGKYMGDDGQDKGIRVMISTLRRLDVSSTMPFAKLTGAYIGGVLARREATKNGLDEAILLDPNGYVAEGSGENLFMVKKGVIYTPPQGHILPGVTRDSVLSIAKHLGIETRETPLIRNQLYTADELFFSGTAVEVTPIVEVDHYRIADGRPGPIAKQVMSAFFQCVRGENPKFKHWLTEIE